MVHILNVLLGLDNVLALADRSSPLLCHVS